MDEPTPRSKRKAATLEEITLEEITPETITPETITPETPQSWSYRPSVPGGRKARYIRTFANGTTSQIVEMSSTLYLATLYLPSGERIGQIGHFPSGDIAKQWIETQAETK